MKTVLTKFKGSFKFLYLVADVILKLVKLNIQKFGEYKTMYTTAYADQMLDQLAAAEALPNYVGSRAERKQTKIDLKAATILVRDTYQKLKGFIEKAWQQGSWKTQLEKAGSEFFVKGESDWSSTVQVAKMMKEYVRDNSAKLQENNNMPLSFETELATVTTAFATCVEKFTKSNDLKKSVVDAKNTANNALYQLLVDVSKDAAVVFIGFTGWRSKLQGLCYRCIGQRYS